MFGLEFSVLEIATLLSIFAAIVGGWYNINQKLADVIERNSKADKAHALLEAKINSTEIALRQEIKETKSVTDNQMQMHEQRLRTIDIFAARMEEKFLGVEEKLKRVIDLLERPKKDL
jgi:hypothetical protein